MPGAWPRPDTAALSRLAQTVGRRAGRRDRPARRPDRVRRGRRPGAGVRRGCGWSSWSTCRSATSPSPRTTSAPSSRRPAPSSRPARGRGSGCWPVTGCPRSGCTSPGPGRTGAQEAPGTPGGGRLLCVAAVVPHKGQDLLLDALGRIASLPWCCTVVGPLDRDPPFVDSAPPPGRRLRHGRPDLLRRAAGGRGAAPAVPGGGRAGPAVPSRGVRDGRHRGAGGRAAGRRGRRRWGARGAGADRRRPPGTARAARRRGRPRRGARHLVARRRPAGAAASGGPRTTGDAERLGRDGAAGGRGAGAPGRARS